MIEENKWYVFENKHPDENQKVLVFRIKKEKFVVAKLSYRKDDKDDDIEKGWDWVTEQNLCHNVEPNDLWLKFKELYLTFEYTK